MTAPSDRWSVYGPHGCVRMRCYSLEEAMGLATRTCTTTHTTTTVMQWSVHDTDDTPERNVGSAQWTGKHAEWVPVQA